MNEFTFPIIFMLAIVVAEGLVIAKTQKGTVTLSGISDSRKSGLLSCFLSLASY